MKEKISALALAMCLAVTPVLAANPYTDDWGSKFGDVLDEKTETFVGYSERKETATVYYLAPESTVYIGKQVEEVGYLEIKRGEIRSLEETEEVETTRKTYTRDQFEETFGAYDLYCLITRTDAKNKEYEYLYFLFDDSAASNAADYVLQRNGTQLERYRGSGGAMVIPDGVVEIRGMFMDTGTAAEVTSLTFPKSVREIDGWTFNNCTELTSVTLPNNLQTLGDCAFSGCSRLSSVVIPGSLTDVGSSVFSDCGLSRVTIQAGLRTIGSSMFSGCQKLVAITIPSSVTQVESRAFAGCISLTSVNFENGNTQIASDAFAENRIPGLIMQAPPLTISAPAGGSVEAYCQANGIAFRAVGSVPNVPVTPSAPPASAAPTNDSLTADGVLQTPTVYKINDSNYFQIRDLAAVLNGTGKQFSVGYDSSLSSVTATTGQGYAKQAGDLAGAPAGGTKEAQPSNDTIYINGKKVAAEVYKIDGNNYFKLRDLGKALNFYVGWSAEQGMYIETDKPYTE